MSEFKTRLHSVPSGGFLTDRDKDKKPILDVRELGIDFGGLTAVDNFNLMIGLSLIHIFDGDNGVLLHKALPVCDQRGRGELGARLGQLVEALALGALPLGGCLLYTSVPDSAAAGR